MIASKVWLVDDDKIFTFTVKKMIGKFRRPYQLETFGNGKLAIDRLINIEPANIPDVILLDINMPVMDGWQFLDSFIHYPHKDQIIIFLVSSSIDPNDKLKSKLYKEVKEFVVKPVTPKSLSNILKVVDQKQAS
ncbi:response regulator [Nonlabens ponticola]|uniref:Response regulator n=1 Tax=Nonlabens ponticola TaxID=2496866 RepID=A0A3S9MVT6_9FLAO|nr:response regulator [Nonlabens ponticola]AZQ43336.1 response regulator [Nonlabens ponticola]